MLILGPNTKQLGNGDETGLIFSLDGPVLPGEYAFGSYFDGGHIIVPGPDNLPGGNYSIVASGGLTPALAKFRVLLPMNPGKRNATVGNMANGELIIPVGTCLMNDDWDLIPGPAPAAAKAA